MKKTNFDRFLEEQMQDPAFAARFKQAGEAWDVALQIAALREQAGLQALPRVRQFDAQAQRARVAVGFGQHGGDTALDHLTRERGKARLDHLTRNDRRRQRLGQRRFEPHGR